MMVKESKPEVKALEGATSFCQVLRWSSIIIVVALMHAQLGVVFPSAVTLQGDILNRTTDCGKSKTHSDCTAQAAQYSGLATSVQAAAGFLVAAPYGVAADRFGRKPFILLAFLAQAWQYPFLAGTPSSLTPYYLVFSAAGLLPFTQQMIVTIVSDLSPAGTRLERFGYVTAFLALFYGMGSFFGWEVVSRIGIQRLLKGTIGVTGLTLMVLLVFLPETLPANKESLASSQRRDAPSQQEDGPVTRKSVIFVQSWSAPKQSWWSIAKSFCPSKNADTISKWQLSFYWLNVISALPEAGFMAISTFFVRDKYGFGAHRLGVFSATFMVCGFVWQTIGLRILTKLCPNKGRIFQVATLLNLAHFVPYIFCKGSWAPFASAALGGASMVATVVLRAIMADLADPDCQGTAMGVIYACTSVCAVIGPGLFGATFHLCAKYGVPTLPFALVAFGLLPFSIGLASFTLLPDSIPPSLLAKTPAPTVEPLLSAVEGGES